MNSLPDRHFLDSSVVRPFLSGSKAYKQYFKKYFSNERLYISNFVHMEIVRGFVLPLLNFYFILDLPNIKTIGDALHIESHSFRTRELKSILQLMAIILEKHLYDFDDPKDKRKALRSIARIIKCYVIKLKRNFKNIGDQGSRCRRAEIMFSKQVESDKELFKDFLNRFLNLSECENSCKIKSFLCEKHKIEVEKYIEHASSIQSPSIPQNRGFVRISKTLDEILKKTKKTSCKTCEAVGDAVIAIEVPPNMTLEYTDYSFDHLCELIEKPHNRHPSEIVFVKQP